MSNDCRSSYPPIRSAVLFVFLLMSLALLLLSCGGAASANSSGSCDFKAGGNCSISVNGVVRSYLLHIPPGFQANSSALVIALHGSQQSGSQMETISELSSKADQV